MKLVRDFRERRGGLGDAHPLGLLLHVVEDSLDPTGGLANPQSDQTERRSLIEDHHQNQSLPNDGNVDIVLAALVEEDGELPLPDQPRQAVGGRHVARGERGKRRCVHQINLTGPRDLLAVLVDQKHDLCVGVDAKAVEELRYPIELLLIHDKTRVHAPWSPVSSHSTQPFQSGKDECRSAAIIRPQPPMDVPSYLASKLQCLGQRELVHGRELSSHRYARGGTTDLHAQRF